MLIGGDDLLRRRKRPLDGACLGRQLDGESRQGNAEASENLKNMTISPSRWFAGVFARYRKLDPLPPSAAAENLSGSRIKSAIYALSSPYFPCLPKIFTFFKIFPIYRFSIAELSV